MAFDVIPSRIQLLQRAIGHLFSLRFNLRFDRPKPPREFIVRVGEKFLGVELEMAGQVDDGEQEIAEFLGGFRTGFRASPRWRGQRRNRTRSRAVTSAISSRTFSSEPRTSGQSKPTLRAFFCSASARISAGSERGTPSSALARSGFSAFFNSCHWATTPVGIGHFHIAKNVRMAADQLVGDAVGHVGKSELPGLPRDLGLKDDVEQQVAEFLRQMLGEPESMASITS